MQRQNGLLEILTKIKNKPGMYLGKPSVSDLFVFLAGYKTARRELNIQATEQELSFYQEFHEFVQEHYHVHSSNSWAKIIMFNCPDEQRGFEKFFELLESFQSAKQEAQSSHNDLVAT